MRCHFITICVRSTPHSNLLPRSIPWLLVTEISVERNIPYGGLTVVLRCAAQSMVYWKGRGLTMTSLQIVMYEVNGL
jgi:hypothetical protein